MEFCERRQSQAASAVITYLAHSHTTTDSELKFALKDGREECISEIQASPTVTRWCKMLRFSLNMKGYIAHYRTNFPKEMNIKHCYNVGSASVLCMTTTYCTCQHKRLTSEKDPGN
eukprot:2468038-Amphidinium_carterae.1